MYSERAYQRYRPTSEHWGCGSTEAERMVVQEWVTGVAKGSGWPFWKRISSSIGLIVELMGYKLQSSVSSGISSPQSVIHIHFNGNSASSRRREQLIHRLVTIWQWIFISRHSPRIMFGGQGRKSWQQQTKQSPRVRCQIRQEIPLFVSRGVFSTSAPDWG